MVLKFMMIRKTVLITCLAAALVLVAAPAQAATIWTDWTSATAGANGGGSATGVAGAVGVSYSGELDAAVLNGTSSVWSPLGSFTGGTVTISPSVVGDDLRLDGSFTGINTITFLSPVENPVFAIWSLGSPSIAATFTFNATPTFQAGGPNSSFGGLPIAVVGNVVSGNEGNGVVQFAGTFSSISWTGTFENFYAFTVGVNGPLNGVPVPEPTTSTLTLIGSGLVGLVYRLRKR